MKTIIARRTRTRGAVVIAPLLHAASYCASVHARREPHASPMHCSFRLTPLYVHVASCIARDAAAYVEHWDVFAIALYAFVLHVIAVCMQFSVAHVGPTEHVCSVVENLPPMHVHAWESQPSAVA